MTRGLTVAVFTKNRTNAAYEGARLGADRVAARMGGKAVHYVPDTPDDVEQQVALVDRALAARPDLKCTCQSPRRFCELHRCAAPCLDLQAAVAR